MNNSFATLFYIRQNKPDKLGRCLIYLRITIDGERAEMSTKRKIKSSQWNSRSGKAKATNNVGIDINRYLNELEVKAFRVYEQLKDEGAFFTPESIRDELDGRKAQLKMISVLYESHNQEIFELVQREEYSEGAYWRHCRTAKHLKAFMQKEYGFEDMPIKQVDLYFIKRFEHFLKTSIKATQNTITKYIVNFKKIVRIAYANDWIAKDPFFNWKANWKAVERQALTELELQHLIDKTFEIERLDNVKDIFLFCCFTGLSYADVKKLSSDHIVMDINNHKWIKTIRTKTKTRSNIPLLPHAEAILYKYDYNKNSSKNKLLLPVISNQKLNAYLKEIAIICRINKKLTFHLSRHTFATTVTLANGVPIESVSKMLGHQSLKTTQIYAKVIDTKLKEDMDKVKAKYL
ncbi:site-specific integrase [Ascidiimonas sp. W6]|uniref:site-specific integrase n=1 Tax=Ascidiimonas meishanensis TaxID=3128903 RepID=UPI0030EB3CE5